ncbi:MAG: chorismate-binding protein [Burkholderiales bacterium]|nr:chorismate-binding protein [Burkholderiales bacterium]
MNAALASDLELPSCSAAIEVDPLPPERLLAVDADPVAAFIAPDGEAWVGVGAARWLDGGAGSAALWSGLLDQSPDAPGPMAIGALPFRAGEAADPLWSGLLPGGVVLPERLYIQRGGRAWWRLTLPRRESATLRSRLTQERAWLAQLAAAETLPLAAARPLPEGDAPQRYADAVTRAVARIRAGELAKVVLARRCGVAFDTAPAPAALLARLSERHPNCLRYAWKRGARTWLGATPETLVRVDGRRLATQALAGTRTSERAAELLASTKDQHEHAIVVEAIRAAIAPYCVALSPRREPVLRPLRGLAHLHTAIEATLRDDVDFMRLVDALHPTPAVCGLPADRAAALLRALEPEPRGLYAGPFLRLASDGGGHAVVALRGAIVAGRQLVVPAGAGIVDGSEGEAELAETRVKQRSVLDAFGARDGA